MSGIKTRKKASTAMSDLIGKGKDFIPSELPTLGAVLRKAILIKELSEKKIYPLDDLIKETRLEVVKQWKKANSDFSSPVIFTDKSIDRKIKKSYSHVQDICRKRLTIKKEIDNVMKSMSRLFDITTCKCAILYCIESNCLGCEKKVHINCKCEKSTRIPLLELEFIHSQRNKEGEKAQVVIGSRDSKEVKRKRKAIDRSSKRENCLKKLKEKEVKSSCHLKKTYNELLENFNNNEECSNNESDCSNYTENYNVVDKIEDFKLKRNYMKIQNTAIAAIRYEVSNTAAAAIASGFLKDLVEAKIVPESALFLLLDKNKVHRARDKVMSECQNIGENRFECDVSCILFDGRSDKTNILTFNEETKKFYPSVKKEDHYTLTDEYGKYLNHLTKEIPKKSKIKPAEYIANEIFQWCTLHGVEDTLKFIGCDSTATNTGHNGGVIHCLELKLERKLGWLICALHTNELCFRHLVEELDGKTTSKTGFSGPIGKLLTTVTEMERNFSFKQISVGPGLIELREEVVKDLSSDQKYAYKICQTVISETLTEDLANQKPGTVVHSRWLNTGSSLLLLWVCKHGLEGDNLKNLELIVKFLVSVYFPMWFQIKVKHSWIEGPRHILNQISLIKLQDENVQKIIEKYVRSSAWNSHSEIVLQTLLCSQNKIEREFSVNKILEIRKNLEMGNLATRTYKLPYLNLAATKLTELITWEEAYEPILTCQMNSRELEMILDCPMVVPYFPIHTQGVERAVKEVTAASETVFGFERRDGFIRARAESRAMIPRFNSKQDLVLV